MGKLPKNVADAVEYADGIFDGCDNGEWQTIRAHLLNQEAEIADYKNASLHAADDCMAKDAEIARLRGELAEAVADARRYRWLRDNCKREWESDMPHSKGAPSLDIDFSADGHDLDAAIDDAMHNSAREDGE